MDVTDHKRIILHVLTVSALRMNIDIKLPRWLAKLLFPKTFTELERRSALTGTASKSGGFGKGPLSVDWVRTVEKPD